MQQRQHRGPMPYIERDTSWMYFNKRILLEAMRPDLPLLERFNYLGIYSNNLDEFFRVRVASLRRLIDSAEELPSAERKKAKETLRTILRLNREYSQLFDETFAQLVRELKDAHIHIINEHELTSSQEEEVLSFFMTRSMASPTRSSSIVLPSTPSSTSRSRSIWQSSYGTIRRSLRRGTRWRY